MEDVGILYGHLVYFTPVWYILRPFGIFYGYLTRFGMLYQEKSGNPGFNSVKLFAIQTIVQTIQMCSANCLLN
jgi:hypothetical protein